MFIEHTYTGDGGKQRLPPFSFSLKRGGAARFFVFHFLCGFCFLYTQYGIFRARV
jgi:hypothetical protein